MRKIIQSSNFSLLPVNHSKKLAFRINNLHTSGFTFLELLIVISIMVLFFGLGFANFRDYQSRQKLTSAQRVIKADLRYAQEQALAGIKPGVSCDILNGYKVEYVSRTRYSVSANCNTNEDFLVKTVDLEQIAPLIEIQSAFPVIFFNVLGRGVRMSDTSVDVNLLNTRNNQNLIITITKGGEIS